MKVRIHKLFATMMILLLASAALAVSWELDADPAPGYYEFASTSQSGSGGYSIDISATDTVDENGETLHMVTSSSWGYQPMSSMLLQPGAGSAMLFNPGSFMMYMIPMFLDGLDMEPGERAVMPGFGRITVLDPEVHGGITGHTIVIEERDSDDEWQPLLRIVFNENIPVPLLSAYYDGGELIDETKLVEFREY